MSRQSRKLDHLRFTMELPDGPADSGFGDITLIHNCLPELALKDIDLSTSCAGLSLSHPIIINAMTGGSDAVRQVNAELAEFAQATKSVMAVGSQRAALENPESIDSYSVVRKVYPDGIFWANLSAQATVEDAKRAVDMIGAVALQIHLNPAQELVMGEGDRDFSKFLSRVTLIASGVGVPVIIKEVGFGIAMEQASRLAAAGVRAIDVGGAGGTNFIAVEAARTDIVLPPELASWGIPTAISAVETASVIDSTVSMIVSGGVRTPLDVVKSLALGGCAVGMASPVLRMTREAGLAGSVKIFNDFLDQIRLFMALVGAPSIQALHQIPLVITGRTADWLAVRGIDVRRFGIRG